MSRPPARSSDEGRLLGLVGTDCIVVRRCGGRTLEVPATRATEQRDAEQLLTAYADDAVVRVLDRSHPPRTPLVISGREAIQSWLRDTYSGT